MISPVYSDLNITVSSSSPFLFLSFPLPILSSFSPFLFLSFPLSLLSSSYPFLFLSFPLSLLPSSSPSLSSLSFFSSTSTPYVTFPPCSPSIKRHVLPLPQLNILPNICNFSILLGFAQCPWSPAGLSICFISHRY